ncbi:hypothetical protein PV10_07959 [Exophiala mesophila]|uniref:Vacuolar ATPase assembly protein VMA22 n=1 Tax=Exophiala mesophila TaxID=212818 RepID=A0A0D1Z093_EXOME|nr:uncharacterized protein PV10_07959 [Exophiala mesophila]KIV88262.1 hypothetical protein PV10_07959 [Exophiala mesophila]
MSISPSPFPSLDSTIPEPSLEPLEPSSSLPSQTSTISAQLDDLLVRYLTLLDTYTALRSHLSKEFSSGFISLAQANRTSNLGPGRRYGEEGYDERMKSLWNVVLEPKHHEHPCLTASVGTENDSGTSRQKRCASPASTSIPQKFEVQPDHQGLSDRSTTKDHDHPKSGLHTAYDSPLMPFSPLKPQSLTSVKPKQSMSQSTIHDATWVSEHVLEGPIDDDEIDYSCIIRPAAATDSDATTNKVTDPLKWYGILIPPALRQTQSHFTTTVTTVIPRLLDVTRALHTLETQIRRLREEIRTAGDFPESGTTAGDGGQEECPEIRDGLGEQKTLAQDMSSLSLNGWAANSGNRLVTTEPRSRLLRLE